MNRKAPHLLWMVATCLLALTVACTQDSGTETRGPPRTPGLLRHVGPVELTCHGVDLSPGDRVHAVMRAHVRGTTYCFSPGVYRLRTPLRPQQGDALVGRRGAVLDGSRVLRGWHRRGATWTTRAYLPESPSTHGECRPQAPTCTYAEDVFLDGHRLRRVAVVSAVSDGTFHADYRTNSVTVGDDPRGRLLEQAVAPSLVRSSRGNVTVANLVLEQAANEAQVGAVEARRAGPTLTAGEGWRIHDNEVRLNHGVGIGFGGSSSVVGNFIHGQGQLGFGAWGTGSILKNNEIAFNGSVGYSAGWEAGGGKSWKTTRLRVVHNHVHHNMGPGLWSDGGNINTRYAYNRITRNWRAGIQHEISYDTSILRNVIVGNGRRHKRWAWGAGIQIQSSGGLRVIDVAHNVVRNNANGITVIDSGSRMWESPAPHGPHIVRNVKVHHNTVTMHKGQATGAVEDRGDASIFTSNRVRFDHNSYYLESFRAPHFLWAGEDLRWAAWRSIGQKTDPHGRARLLRDR